MFEETEYSLSCRKIFEAVLGGITRNQCVLSVYELSYLVCFQILYFTKKHLSGSLMLVLALIM